MSRVTVPALVYFAVMLAAGFVLGTLRVLILVPHLGELAAVTLEVPVMLALSWLAAGWVLRRWPVTGTGLRLAMGAIAFLMLMVAEAVLTVLLFGRPLASMPDAILTLPGLVGLAGQIGFALVPALRGQTSG